MKGLVLAVVLAALPGGRAFADVPAPTCSPASLALSVRPGSGTDSARLLLRNASSGICRLQPLPLLGFANRSGHAIAARRRAPVGFHPGPVLIPPALPPGGSAEADLHWTDRTTTPGAHCATASTLLVVLPGGILHQGLTATFCAASGDALAFEQTPFRAARRSTE